MSVGLMTFVERGWGDERGWRNAILKTTAMKKPENLESPVSL